MLFPRRQRYAMYIQQCFRLHDDKFNLPTCHQVADNVVMMSLPPYKGGLQH